MTMTFNDFKSFVDNTVKPIFDKISREILQDSGQEMVADYTIKENKKSYTLHVAFLGEYGASADFNIKYDINKGVLQHDDGLSGDVGYHKTDQSQIEESIRYALDCELLENEIEIRGVR